METIKEEKKADLEQLLNSLIEKGWKPFGDYDIAEFNQIENTFVASNYESKVIGQFNIRQLVSKESGLWQFCIANHLLKKYSDLGDDGEYIIGRWQDGKDCKTEDGEYIDDNRDSDIYHQDESYQRWVIESSLKDESELEDFLLSNINVD